MSWEKTTLETWFGELVIGVKRVGARRSPHLLDAGPSLGSLNLIR